MHHVMIVHLQLTVLFACEKKIIQIRIQTFMFVCVRALIPSISQTTGLRNLDNNSPLLFFCSVEGPTGCGS